jgi:predicted DCC family thiol-disulfide oxidoreductase YuxK
MTVYLIKKENELQIHQVRPDQETRFLTQRGDKILMSDDSIKEVLTAFQELPIVFATGIDPLP